MRTFIPRLGQRRTRGRPAGRIGGGAKISGQEQRLAEVEPQLDGRPVIWQQRDRAPE